MDQRCVFYEKPLLESGTLGTKGNTQVIVPHLTESYASSQDPPEKETPSCTVKNFPNVIQHTIEVSHLCHVESSLSSSYCLLLPFSRDQWSRKRFDQLFVLPAQDVNSYLSEPGFVEQTIKYGGSHTEKFAEIREYLVRKKPLTFDECIVWARMQFEEDYGHSIRQLLFSLPKDAVREALPCCSHVTHTRSMPSRPRQRGSLSGQGQSGHPIR